MSWTANVKGSPEEIEQLVQGVQESPVQDSEDGKVQVAAAKDAAVVLLDALDVAEGNLAAVYISGHVGQGNTGTSSMSVAVHEALPEPGAAG